MIPMNSAAHNQVYYVQTNENPTIRLGPLAIKPYTNNRNDIIKWTTTSPSFPGVSLKIENISILPLNEGSFSQKINVNTKNGDHIELIPLTMSIYNEKVRNRLFNSLDFDNEKDLQDYFLNSNFKA
jgi:hypothetical protein